MRALSITSLPVFSPVLFRRSVFHASVNLCNKLSLRLISSYFADCVRARVCVYIYMTYDSLIKIDVGASERIVKFVKIKEIPKKKHLGNAISSRGYWLICR